ncbi:hypothetical protein T4E_4744 [Trichinella pseudospiralis]|uniref:Uncharacterized protein n=1 Tax=Trichinella pseudospiralis TaxID=6337 RepID=A0A0V0XUV1_TRIPS|nr:hypothetical protein T4E_4744 [Trichinella pseudospiralis]
MTFISMASLKPICKVYNLVPVTAEEKRCRFEQYEMVVMGFISVNQFRRTDHRLATARSPVPPAKLVKTLQVRLDITFVHVQRQCSQGQASRQASKQASSQAGMCLSFPKRRRSV